MLFTNDRYVTKVALAKIPAEIVLGLWIMIDNRRNYGGVLNYLQVFKLSAQDGEQRIIHTQSMPDYHSDVLVKFIAPPIDAETVFVIDDGKCSTMLLADEY
jgi:hypothetical protein